ncbi:hypothetical protein L6W60_004300 [Salmonella enterica]|nr:hypothetical protein [Salmonella enterica]EHC5973213.1 hypothetical protein [Salmonella enterica]EIU9581668.1 hypothetical protein [Salmonella enterica]ELC1719895.1 hypothetical protein [Salmonella enterica]
MSVALNKLQRLSQDVATLAPWYVTGTVRTE